MKAKIRKSEIQICSENPEHKFIRTRTGQTKCPFCEDNRPYPPPITISWREEQWREDWTD